MSKQSSSTDTLPVDRAERSDSAATTEGGKLRDIGATLAGYWKSWVLVLLFALVTWTLYDLGDSTWTLDATVFAAATAAIVGYRLWTLREDID